MDPKACLGRIIDAFTDKCDSEAIEAASDLINWYLMSDKSIEPVDRYKVQRLMLAFADSLENKAVPTCPECGCPNDSSCECGATNERS